MMPGPLFELFGSARPVIDMTAGPTLEPRRQPDARPGIITSPMPEPGRRDAITAAVVDGERQARDQRYLAALAAAGSLGLSDAEAAIRLRLEPASICSARGRVRTQLWIARRVHGAHGVRVWAWRLATPAERAQNEQHERALKAAGKRWSAIVPAVYRENRS